MERLARRSWMKWAIVGLNGLVGFIVGIPAAIYALVDPSNRPNPPSGFRPVAKMSELQDGVPFQAVVRDTRYDAWTLHPNDLIGRVWLIKDGASTVRAYTTICSHLGCSINLAQDQDAGTQQFVCPCHKGTWELSGERVSGPVPRDMDHLETKLEPIGDTGDAVIAVKYQNFRQGEQERTVKT